jgi:hypothetical protein
MINQKYVPIYNAFNCTSVIITTNHRTDGLYLPADDRRHYAAWSEAKREDMHQAFWDEVWNFYERQNGFAHVRAFLLQRDLSKFNAKAPPAKTAWFDAIVDANCAPEEGALADVVEKLGAPDALTLAALSEAARKGHLDLYFLITDKTKRRAIPHRLEKAGYVACRNDTAKDGLWKINGRRQTVYTRSNLSLKHRTEAARRLVGR